MIFFRKNSRNGCGEIKDKVYQRTTISMTFSLIIALLEDLDRLQPYEVEYRNRSQLVVKFLMDYVNRRKKELGWSEENGT